MLTKNIKLNKRNSAETQFLLYKVCSIIKILIPKFNLLAFGDDVMISEFDTKYEL